MTMVPHNSNNEALGYSTVQPTLSTSDHNRPLHELVNSHSYGSSVTRLGFSGTLEVSGMNKLYSGASSDVGKIVSRVGSQSCSIRKPYKKKNRYYTRRSNEKKERLIWTDELHQYFLECYYRLPEKKRVPKRIWEEMVKKFDYVTRENVASHLQKFRLYLKAKEKKKEITAKPSPKSLLPKVTNQEINYPNFYNGTSTPQIQNQINLISTNPNSQLPPQSPSFSNSPNCQSHSLSTIPSYQLPHQPGYVQTDLSNPYTQHVQSSSLDGSLNNNHSTHGDAIHYSNRMNGFFEDEEEENYARFALFEEYKGAYNNSDSITMDNYFLPSTPINHQSISYFDAFNPTMGNTNNIEGLNYGNYSDYSQLGALPNFIDNDMNLNGNHNAQVDSLNDMYDLLGSNFDANLLLNNAPFNSNIDANDFQMSELEQAVLQSMFYPPGDDNLVNIAFGLPKNNIENPWKIDSNSTGWMNGSSLSTGAGCSSKDFKRIMR